MLLEKHKVTRPVAKALLRLGDKLNGQDFPTMIRAEEIGNYACGPATLEMLLSFVGVKTTQIGLIASIRAQNTIKKYGINLKDMAKAAKAKGKGKITFWVKHNATINDIFLAIEKFKSPVGVEWQGEFYENEDEDPGHYSVVTKINKNKKSGTMRMSDPYFNNFFRYKNIDREIKIKEFTRKWWDTNEIRVEGTTRRRKIMDVKVMFVITLSDTSWPKKLGMKKI